MHSLNYDVILEEADITQQFTSMWQGSNQFENRLKRFIAEKYNILIFWTIFSVFLWIWNAGILIRYKQISLDKISAQDLKWQRVWTAVFNYDFSSSIGIDRYIWNIHYSYIYILSIGRALLSWVLQAKDRASPSIKLLSVYQMPVNLWWSKIKCNVGST